MTGSFGRSRTYLPLLLAATMLSNTPVLLAGEGVPSKEDEPKSRRTEKDLRALQKAEAKRQRRAAKRMQGK